MLTTVDARAGQRRALAFRRAEVIAFSRICAREEHLGLTMLAFSGGREMERSDRRVRLTETQD